MSRFATLCYIVILGCSQSPSESTLDYSPLAPAYAGALQHVKGDTISVCLYGMTIEEQWGVWTADAVKAWLEPLHKMSTTPIASKVTLVTADHPDCKKAHVTVELRREYLRAYCQVGDRPHIVVSRQDARDGRVILHEMGHAFGMGDTYYGPGSGSQPDSVMKTARFYSLQPDDLEGLTYLYRRDYGETINPLELPTPVDPVEEAPGVEPLTSCIKE